MCHAPGYGTDSSENPTIDPGTRELEEDASATMSTIDFRSIGWNCAVRVFTPSSWLHAGCCYEAEARNKPRHAHETHVAPHPPRIEDSFGGVTADEFSCPGDIHRVHQRHPARFEPMFDPAEMCDVPGDV